MDGEVTKCDCMIYILPFTKNTHHSRKLMMDFANSADIFMENGNIDTICCHTPECVLSYTSFKLRLVIHYHYLMECDLGHLSEVVLSLVTLQEDLDLDGGEACKLYRNANFYPQHCPDVTRGFRSNMTILQIPQHCGRRKKIGLSSVHDT